MIIPYLNTKDLIDISQDILKKVEVIPVKTIDEVLKIALTKDPENLKVNKSRTNKKSVSKNHLVKIDKSIAH